MNLPENLKYTQEHIWLKINKNQVTLGITDFAQSQLGDIVYVDISILNHDFKIGDVFGSIEAVKTVSDLFMPLNAKILEFNHELENNPELINSDPYEKGWIIKIELLDNNINNLLNAEEYKNITE